MLGHQVIEFCLGEAIAFLAAGQVFLELLLRLCRHRLLLRERVYLSVKVDFLFFQTIFRQHQDINLRAQIARLFEHFELTPDHIETKILATLGE